MNFSSSVQTVGWFRDRYREGTLIIKPPYQRKPVWAMKQKCSLIESILMNLPVPEIYIQQTTLLEPEEKNVYAIVDGQQRIRTILQFVGSEKDPEEEEHNKFPLDKLDPNSEWRNLTFNELSDDQKKRFYGYQFTVRYLDTDNDNEVRDMFRRLNRFLTPLKPQELRNATFTGPFVKLVLDLSDKEFWAENRIVSPATIRRMGDVEFVSELLIGVLHGPQGGSAKVIDDYYSQYEDYEDESPDQRRARKLFEDSLEMVQRVCPNIKETRWNNKTDFYTLFVLVASLLRTGEFVESRLPQVKESLKNFAEEVDRRLGNEGASVGRNAIEYVRAVEKGANDKKRRADRQAALLNIIGVYFKQKK